MLIFSRLSCITPRDCILVDAIRECRALDFQNDPAAELEFFGPYGLGVDGYFGGDSQSHEEGHLKSEFATQEQTAIISFQEILC